MAVFFSHRFLAAGLTGLVIVLSASAAFAEEQSSAPAAAIAEGQSPTAAADDQAAPQTRWGFFFNLGYGDTKGDFDPAFRDATTGEFGVFQAKGPWRYGFGLSFGSFGMEPPYDNELEWGFQRIFVSATRVFNENASLRPYLQGRIGIVRLHPRSELFMMDPLPEDFETGDSPTKASNGIHIGVVPGIEWQMTRTLALDASVLLDYWHVGETDLSPIGQEPASNGFDWQARLGVLWWNDGGPGTEPTRDAWGVPRSWGWAMGEALAINFGASAFNEYVRNANFNQISPRSWWANLEEGLTYDDNQFKTNQFIHPFNGSCYYNAARSNGLGFWSSYGVALIGAFHWEWMGETHPMSFNDLISTGIGGAAMGETGYRFSSMLLDNEATGSGRFWREAGSFIIDPVRGFNRLVSGRAWKVAPNPSDPIDTDPPGQVNILSLGWREIGNGKYPSLTHDTSSYSFLQYLHSHGDVFDNDRRGPWDYFVFEAEGYSGEKTKLGKLFMRGNWLTTRVGEADPMQHAVAIVQHFDYVNTNAYEFGGQSIGGALFSRWGKVGPLDFRTRFDIAGTLMGAVNSDYSDLAEVANQERIREYDYGPGALGGATVSFGYKGKPLFSANYRLDFIYVTNGSIYNGQDPEVGNKIGLDARHWLHGADLRFDSPTWKNFGVGAQYTSFTRESHYKITFPEEPELAEYSITQLKRQTNPELKVFVTYYPGGE